MVDVTSRLHSLAPVGHFSPWNESCIDIRVSKPSLGRALAIMAAIIAVLEDNGVKVKVAPSQQSWGTRSVETTAIIFGEKYSSGFPKELGSCEYPIQEQRLMLRVARTLSDITRRLGNSRFKC